MRTYSCLSCGKEHEYRGLQFANKYCNNQCQKDYEYKSFITEWKQNKQNGVRKRGTSRHIKRYILEKQDYKCKICGISEHMGLPIVLELDHISGDHTNNAESNLRCLCPNCHSQTPTYKAKNKGQGRKHR